MYYNTKYDYQPLYKGLLCATVFHENKAECRPKLGIIAYDLLKINP